jgi:rfaE bifunctional protein kinase chain/domain/rfaE bifunctional protein nucleotidyltransferase chain/domain
VTDPGSPLGAITGLTPAVPALVRRAAPTVTVIGEPILDGWWRGTSERMTREAPAPVVDLTVREYAPGGAANTAMNLAALGARVRMVGIVGRDDAGDRLREILETAGVDVTGLLAVEGRRTTAKNRIVSGDQLIVRIDEAEEQPVAPAILDALATAALEATEGADAEVVCDYGAGTLTGPVLEALAARDIRPALTVVDAHDARPWAALRPHLVTPNAAEASALAGTALRGDRAAAALAHAETILAATNAADVVVTLDADGTVLLGRSDEAPHRTAARPATEKQASGAGDTFVAALVAGRAAGLPLRTSVDLAQAAADVVVHRFGTSVCTTDDLVVHLGGQPTTALDDEQLRARVAAERAAGKRIVLTNGCFDVLHLGHTTYLSQAKQLGDVLIVAVNSDASARRLKGEGRPINPAHERAGVLASLSCVDYVTVFDTDTPIPLIEWLRPDIYAKGGDYSPEMLEESAVVRAGGGEVQILDYVADHSTTAVVDRIRSSPGGV